MPPLHELLELCELLLLDTNRAHRYLLQTHIAIINASASGYRWAPTALCHISWAAAARTGQMKNVLYDNNCGMRNARCYRQIPIRRCLPNKDMFEFFGPLAVFFFFFLPFIFSHLWVGSSTAFSPDAMSRLCNINQFFSFLLTPYSPPSKPLTIHTWGVGRHRGIAMCKSKTQNPEPILQ